MLYVKVILSDGAPATPTAVKWGGSGGTAMTLIDDTGVVESFLRACTYRLIAPTVQTSTVYVDFGATVSEVVIIAENWVDTDQTTPNGTIVSAHGTGFTPDPAVTVSSATGKTVTDYCGRFSDGNMTAAGGQTVIQQGQVSNVLNGSASYKAGAASVTTGWSGNAAGTVSSYQWVSVGIPLNDVAGGGGPALTDLDTDGVVTAGQVGATITGTGLGADTSARTLTLEQGAVAVTQSQTSGNATGGVFNVVMEPGGAALKFGAVTAKVTITAGGATATIAGTINPAPGHAYVDVGTPDTTSANRITAAGDISSGDQLQFRGIGGGPLPRGFNASSDGTFYFSAPYMALPFEARAWASSDQTVGSWGVQSINYPLAGKGRYFTGWAKR